MWKNYGNANVKITIPSKDFEREKKKLENVEYLSYLGSPITRNASIVKSRITMTNAAFNKKTAFQQQIALIRKDECHVWSTALFGAGAQLCMLVEPDTSESRSEFVSGKEWRRPFGPIL
jgi:hypothetical protein